MTAKRSSPVARLDKARARIESQRRAIANRTHGPGLVWIVIQCSPSIPMTDSKGAFQVDDGKMLYQPDRNEWRTLAPHDHPEWIKDPEVINKLRNGEEVSKLPEAGGMWYRGIVCKPNADPSAGGGEK